MKKAAERLLWAKMINAGQVCTSIDYLLLPEHKVEEFLREAEAVLADGIVGDGKVICPLHSYKFDLATGTPLGNVCQSLKTYHTELTPERHVLLWLTPPSGWSGEA